MPQLDFFLISKLVVFYFSVATLTGFVLMFYLVLNTWIIELIKIFFKASLINITRSFGSALTSAHGDLLEQFILVVSISKYFFFWIFLIIFFFIVIANTEFVSACIEFVSLIIKDINQESVARAGKNLINLSILFFLVLMFNLVGIIPFSYTFTGSLAAPFFFSFTIMFLCIFNVVLKSRSSSFAGFIPAGTSIYILPLIALIEVISTFAKFISLGIRLFANMFAGHLLLKVFYSISFQIFLSISLFTFLPQILVLIFVVCITTLEIMIAGLQAFVMLLLSVLYIREAESFIWGH